MRSRIKRSASVSTKSDPPPGAPPPTAEKRRSLIGASLRFEGEICSTGSVRIEGQVKGSVAARTLTVARSGEVAGSVAAEIAQIDGLVEGDLAADTVVLGPTAQVFGDITHRSLAVEPGARFEGRAVRSRAATTAGETDPETVTQSPSAAERRPLRPN